MLRPVYTTRFEKDVKLAVRRGKKLEKMKRVMSTLIREELLEPKYRNHHLKGQYTACCECHLEPDWLLIYRIDGQTIQFIRTGSHADLFK